MGRAADKLKEQSEEEKKNHRADVLAVSGVPKGLLARRKIMDEGLETEIDPAQAFIEAQGGNKAPETKRKRNYADDE
jgi:hypothetical protein